MSPTLLRFSRLASLLVLTALHGAAIAQGASPATPVLEVQRLAPQLIGFAGTEANFQSLVDGLARGNMVTLVSVTPDGQLQSATFTPAGSMSALDIARTLEQARQNLISRGITAPTAEQIGVTLLGGSLATPLGDVSVAGVLSSAPVLPAAPPSASTGSSAPSTPRAAGTNGLTVITQQLPRVTTVTPPGSVSPPTSTSASPRLRNTSDSPFSTNTSDTPVPPAAAGPNGPPSPASQMQNRR